MSAESLNQIMQNIQNWLVAAGWRIGAPADPNAKFHISATSSLGLGIDIVQPSNVNELIVIAAGYKLLPQQTSRLREINERRRDEFLWDLKFSLLQAQYQFNFQPPQGLPEQIVVSDTIWFDGLNRNALMKTIDKISNGVLLVIWTLGKELGFPEQNQRPTYTG